PEERARHFAAVGATFSAGFIVGPTIGGLIGQWGGAGSTFWAVAALYAVNFVLGCLLFKETLAASERRPFVLSSLNPLHAVFGMGSMFASGVVYQFIMQGWEMYLMLTFLTLGSVTIPTLIAALSREAPASDQGELQGRLMGVQAAAGIIGPPVGTALFAWFVGPSAPFSWPAAPFMLSCVFIAAAF